MPRPPLLPTGSSGRDVGVGRGGRGIKGFSGAGHVLREFAG